MANWTDEQKAFIRQIVFEAAHTFLEQHVNSCPWGRKLSRLVWIGVGILVCLGVLGLGSLPQLISFLRAASAAH